MKTYKFNDMLQQSKRLILAFVLVMTGLSSCIHDNFDEPPVNGVDPNLNVTMTIADLKAMYTGTHIQITDTNLVIAGIVNADDETGNFYKSIVIQDSTAGILIRVDQSSLYADFPVGRKVYVKLAGLWLGDYGGLIQLGGAATIGSTTEVDYIPAGLLDTYIVKATLNHTVTPIPVTIDVLDDSYQNMLIQLSGVQVAPIDTGKTYADAVLLQTVNINIEDCNDNTIILRNSGYSTFAGQLLPSGNGTLTAVYSVYGSDRQLMIRNPNDLNMGGVRCDPYLNKDFEDGSVTSGGWSVYQVAGPSVTWTTNSQGSVYGSFYGQCKNYLPPNIACETWLISPPMNLTNASHPIFTFENACNYTGDILYAYFSDDYDGTSDPNVSGTWQALPVTLSGGSWSWTNSGNIDLSTYFLSQDLSHAYVAVKYIGTSSNGKTWEIDNITVQEQ